jgi:hypothetical protein
MLSLMFSMRNRLIEHVNFIKSWLPELLSVSEGLLHGINLLYLVLRMHGFSCIEFAKILEAVVVSGTEESVAPA